MRHDYDYIIVRIMLVRYFYGCKERLQDINCNGFNSLTGIWMVVIECACSCKRMRSYNWNNEDNFYIPVLRAGVPCSKMDGVLTGSSTLDAEVDGLGDTHWRGEHLCLLVCLPLWTGSKSKDRLRVAQAIVPRRFCSSLTDLPGSALRRDRILM